MRRDSTTRYLGVSRLILLYFSERSVAGHRITGQEILEWLSGGSSQEQILAITLNVNGNTFCGLRPCFRTGGGAHQRDKVNLLFADPICALYSSNDSSEAYSENTLKLVGFRRDRYSGSVYSPIRTKLEPGALQKVRRHTLVIQRTYESADYLRYLSSARRRARGHHP